MKPSLTLGSSHGSFTFRPGFKTFTQYNSPSVATLTGSYQWKYRPSGQEGVTLYQEQQPFSLLWCVNAGATLEVEHGLPSVMGFERLTTIQRVRVHDEFITWEETEARMVQDQLSLTLTWSSFLSGNRQITCPAPHWNNVVTSQEIVESMFKELAVLPDFLDGPAVHFKNEVTGYEVDLDFFRADILRRYFDVDQVLLSGNDVAIYLNRAKNSLLGDDVRNVPIHFTSSRGGGDHLELQLKGQCTYTLTAAMAEFIDLKTSPFSSRIITVKGNPSRSYSYDCNVYRSRYQDTSPVLAYQLGSQWFFLEVYGSMTPSPALVNLTKSECT